MLFSPLAVYAVISTDIVDPLSPKGGGGFSSLSDVFGFGINLIIGLGWVIAIMSLALAVVGIVLSAGDTKKVKQAQEQLMYTAFGMIILFAISSFRFILTRGFGVKNDWEIPGITDFIRK